jgi:hypothetical protein
MNINSAFPSTYLKAADLQGKSVTLTMDHVTMEDIGGDQKPVLYFQGTERGIVLNKTNTSIISEMYGYETDDWVGKKITIHPARVEFQGRIVDAIRVRLVAVQQQRISQPIKAPPAASVNGARQGLPPATVTDVSIDQPVEFIDDQIPF